MLTKKDEISDLGTYDFFIRKIRYHLNLIRFRAIKFNIEKRLIVHLIDNINAQLPTLLSEGNWVKLKKLIVRKLKPVIKSLEKEYSAKARHHSEAYIINKALQDIQVDIDIINKKYIREYVRFLRHLRKKGKIPIK